MKETSTVMWLEWLWCVLQFVGPMFLRYYPFRKKLKIPLWALGTIIAAVWGGIALCLAIFGYSPDYSMNIYCSVAILIFFPLSCVIIKDKFVKHFFVYLMSYNLMTVSIGISQFVMQRMSSNLLAGNLATLAFYLVTYPFIFRFLRRELEPVMDVDDPTVWKIAWVPMALFYLVIAVATPGMLNAQRVSYVLTRTLLGLLCATFCIILVICLRHAREQAAKEEALTRVHFPVMDNHGNTVTVNVPPGLPRIFGDQERLLQVLLNLVSNAVKHTEGGSVALTARAEENSVAVTVRDTGEGIAPELLPNLFQRYPKNRAAGGHGLGLYICAQIVEAHGGKITVESKAGKGTAVRFSIPAMEQEAVL